MPVRNAVALAIAAVAGFLLGLAQGMDMMSYSKTLLLGEVGLGISVGVGLVVAIGARGRLLERVVVALLRAGLSGGVFAFMFEGLRLLTKRGDVGLAFAAWAYAAILGVLLARLAPEGADRRVPTQSRASDRSRSGHAPRRARSRHAGVIRAGGRYSGLPKDPRERSPGPDHPAHGLRAAGEKVRRTCSEIQRSS